MRRRQRTRTPRGSAAQSDGRPGAQPLCLSWDPEPEAWSAPCGGRERRGQVAVRGAEAGGGSSGSSREHDAPASHLREGAPPWEERRESEAGRIPSQLSPHRRRPIIRRR